MSNLKYFLLFVLCGFSFGEMQAQELLDDAAVFINNGDHYTKSPIVSIDFRAKGAVFLQVSNNKDFMSAEWMPFNAQISGWELQPGQGEKMVYAKYKDSAGNESKIVVAQIILDSELPKNPSIAILQGDITNDRSLVVDLALGVEDAAFMMISNTKSFYGQKWQLYQKNLDGWELAPGEDGPRFVYAKYKDAAQNESEIVIDKIVIDGQAPIDGKVEINKGEIYTIQQNKKITVGIFARGADSMLVSQTKSFEGASWEPYMTTEREIELEGEDGKKEIFVKFKDIANNTSPIYSSTITLDTTPPKDCSVVIDAGAEVTTHFNKRVKLQIAAIEAEFVKISTKESFYGANWQPFRPMIEWELEGEEDGEKTVFVKFKDKAGNVSSVFSDSIVLKREPESKP